MYLACVAAALTSCRFTGVLPLVLWFLFFFLGDSPERGEASLYVSQVLVRKVLSSLVLSVSNGNKVSHKGCLSPLLVLVCFVSNFLSFSPTVFV